MTFHYEKEYNKLSENCPPKDYQPLNITAYRFINYERYKRIKNQ